MTYRAFILVNFLIVSSHHVFGSQQGRHNIVKRGRSSETCQDHQHKRQRQESRSLSGPCITDGYGSVSSGFRLSPEYDADISNCPVGSDAKTLSIHRYPVAGQRLVSSSSGDDESICTSDCPLSEVFSWEEDEPSPAYVPATPLILSLASSISSRQHSDSFSSDVRSNERHSSPAVSSDSAQSVSNTRLSELSQKIITILENSVDNSSTQLSVSEQCRICLEGHRMEYLHEASRLCGKQLHEFLNFVNQARMSRGMLTYEYIAQLSKFDQSIEQYVLPQLVEYPVTIHREMLTKQHPDNADIVISGDTIVLYSSFCFTPEQAKIVHAMKELFPLRAVATPAPEVVAEYTRLRSLPELQPAIAAQKAGLSDAQKALLSQAVEHVKSQDFWIVYCMRLVLQHYTQQLSTQNISDAQKMSARKSCEQLEVLIEQFKISSNLLAKLNAYISTPEQSVKDILSQDSDVASHIEMIKKLTASNRAQLPQKIGSQGHQRTVKYWQTMLPGVPDEFAQALCDIT